MSINKLQYVRENKELSQRQMAKILHISKTSYNNWETEESIIPLKHLNNFCNLFNVTMDYIFCLNDTNTNYKNTNILNTQLIGERLKIIRVNHNLTQEELAKMINTTQSTISDYENGKNLILTGFLFEISKKLNVSMDYIAGRSNIIRTIKK